MTGRHFVDRLPDKWKIGKKPEGADQTRVVGFGLIGAKSAFGEIIDVDEIGPGPLSNLVLSHDDVWQLAAGRRPEYRRACPW